MAVNLWYHVGAANEKPGRTGFAHLFEHMMFQGSKHVGENQINVLQAAGATGINATTDFDRTNYFETMPSDQLELALWLESDRMAFLLETLTARNLANQRDVVRNEWRERKNSPYSLAIEELYRQLFPVGHPYRAAVMGSHADIESVALEDVRDFSRQYYVPNNASLALVGDFVPAKAKQLVEKYFGPIPAGTPAPGPNVPIPAILAPKRVTMTDQVELPRVYKAWLSAPIYQPGDAEADVLAHILGAGRTSRLYQKLVYEKQIAQDAGVGHQSLIFGSLVILYATAKPGVALRDLEIALDDELSSMQASGPTPQEMERTRNSIMANFVFALEQIGGAGGVADRLNGYNHYLGDPGYVAQDWARYEAVSAEDVRQAALRLSTGTSVTVLCEPGPKILDDMPKRERVEVDLEQETASGDSAWRSQPPMAGHRASRELPVPVSFRLANGLTVLFLEQRHLPAITANLVVLGGSGANPVDIPGLAFFAAGMLSRGTAQRSQLQIADGFERLGAQWWVHSGSDAATAGVRVLIKNADAAFEVLSDLVLNPLFGPDEIERLRQDRLVSIAQQQDDPDLLARQVLLNALYGPHHPYGYLDIGTESSNQKMNRADLLQFYSSAFTPQRAGLVMVGDMAQTDAQGLAEQYFGNWSGNPVTTQPPDVKQRGSRRVIIVDRPNAPQTQLMMGQPGSLRNHPDHVAMELMNLILGGMFSSRINSNLREVHGYTYGANSHFEYRRGVGPFLISAAIQTDATASAVAEVFHEIDRLREALPRPEELTLAGESLARSLTSRFDTAGSSANYISDLFVYDLDRHDLQNALAQIPQVSLMDVQRVAGEQLHPESMVVVAVGDAAKIERDLGKLNLGRVCCIGGQLAPTHSE